MDGLGQQSVRGGLRRIALYPDHAPKLSHSAPIGERMSTGLAALAMTLVRTHLTPRCLIVPISTLDAGKDHGDRSERQRFTRDSALQVWGRRVACGRVNARRRSGVAARLVDVLKPSRGHQQDPCRGPWKGEMRPANVAQHRLARGSSSGFLSATHGSARMAYTMVSSRGYSVR